MAHDLHVVNTKPLVTPNQLERDIPLTTKAAATVESARETIQRIICRQDDRLLIWVGPCSIHDRAAAMEWATRLVSSARQLSDKLFVVMRTFFEKGRTTTGWPGLICDPYMDGSNDGEEGLRRARQLLVDINEMGLPCGMEMIDPIVPQYLAELISIATIGARTTESSTQRRLASGLSMPVGFKNSTDGDFQTAINAMIATQYPQSFFGIDRDGQSAVVHTTGNPDSILILRGGRSGTNYDVPSIKSASLALEEKRLPNGVVVDCSHAQSSGDSARQAVVWRDVIDHLPETRSQLIGLMVESFLLEGKQPLQVPADVSKLKYGLSVTDACMSWEATERMLHYTYEHVG